MVRFSRELGQEQKQRLAELAEKTPVTLTLKGGVPIGTGTGPFGSRNEAGHG